MNNVALDDTSKGPAAYIFDPGVIRRSAAGRDVAVLEVSILLHQPIPLESFKNICAIIYDASRPVDVDAVSSIHDPKAQNIAEFIRGLRMGVKGWNQPELYALLVFDFVLIQLGGLRFGSSGNRITDKSAVGVLAAYVADWCRHLQRPPNPA